MTSEASTGRRRIATTKIPTPIVALVIGLLVASLIFVWVARNKASNQNCRDSYPGRVLVGGQCVTNVGFTGY